MLTPELVASITSLIVAVTGLLTIIYRVLPETRTAATAASDAATISATTQKHQTTEEGPSSCLVSASEEAVARVEAVAAARPNLPPDGSQSVPPPAA